MDDIEKMIQHAEGIKLCENDQNEFMELCRQSLKKADIEEKHREGNAAEGYSEDPKIRDCQIAADTGEWEGSAATSYIKNIWYRLSTDNDWKKNT